MVNKNKDVLQNDGINQTEIELLLKSMFDLVDSKRKNILLYMCDSFSEEELNRHADNIYNMILSESDISLLVLKQYEKKK